MITPTSTKSKQYQALGIDEIATDIETVFSAVSTLQDNPSGGVGYKVYSAYITQTATNAPVATVLENTTGETITWSRTGVGTYEATAPTIFGNRYKIVLPQFPMFQYEGEANSKIDVIQVFAKVADIAAIYATNKVTLNVSDGDPLTGNTLEWSSVIDSSFFLEIRIYN